MMKMRQPNSPATHSIEKGQESVSLMIEESNFPDVNKSNVERLLNRLQIFTVRKRVSLVGTFVIFAVTVFVLLTPRGPPFPRAIDVTTWNIAAINNNPFEYWITYDENPAYKRLMEGIEKFIEEPGDKDIKVVDVFTEKMFTELEKRMNKIGWDNVRAYWESDYKNRKIISEFMKDDTLGSKRLASMPDRITNTINVVGSDEPVCRPTVINMYDGDLSTLEKWYSAWEVRTYLLLAQKINLTSSECYLIRLDHVHDIRNLCLTNLLSLKQLKEIRA